MFAVNQLPSAPYANTTTAWTAYDSEENFKRRGNKKYGPIQYAYNSLGFRCDEFNLNSSNQTIFIGCSMTFGEGLNLQDTWAKKVFDKIACSDKTQTTFINLSIPGASWDYISRVTLQTVPLLTPKRVILYLPDMTRREAILPDEFDHVTPYHWVIGAGRDHPYCAGLEITGVEWGYYAYRAIMNLRVIENICKCHNVELIIMCWDRKVRKLLTEFNIFYGRYIDLPALPRGEDNKEFYARDGSHPGIEANAAIARYVSNVMP